MDEVRTLPETRVIVTENASGDDSVATIQTAIENEGWEDWVSFMPLDCNGGFAFGNNAAINPALNSSNPPDYILLLNPDTVVRPGALKVLVDFMEQNPQAGIAGSRLEYPDGTPQFSAFRFHSILSELNAGLHLRFGQKFKERWAVVPPALPQEITQVDWVAGASMIVRRKVFEQVGLMDEGYFMYYEEADFCLQTNKAGWGCYYVPESRVVHLVGQSSGVTDPKAPRKRRPQYWFDSRRRYFVKNHGWLYAVMADVAFAFSFALTKLRWLIMGQQSVEPPQFLTDFLRNSVIAKGFVQSLQ
ncbi:Dolichol-phosphate mannosyltransferase in lipid-linked oligosaccharide synthesis cluster [Richelia intracellularis]|nr:Dolichol-phosphate mannosyltransferase in lipid-linked oligosaccharide synthesis cluster [Richelia intracellularis]